MITSGPKEWNNRLKHPAFWLATCFGVGLLRPAPGTLCSVLTALAVWFLLENTNIVFVHGLIIGFCCLFYGLGMWSATIWGRNTKDHDHSSIVIDEFLGMLLALYPLLILWESLENKALYILLAFVLFRFFDILKPYPISWLDQNVKGAFGVMIDDIVAGIFSAILVYISIYYNVL